MRKVVRPVVLAAMAAFGSLAACSDADRITAPEISDPLVQKLVDSGFRSDMIEDRGEYFVVEGDIRIWKNDLGAKSPERVQGRILPPGSPSRQWVTDHLVGQTEVRSMRVDLSGLSSYPQWADATREAMSHWNAIAGSAVYFFESSSPDITVSTFYNSDYATILALADFPRDATSPNKPGPTIQINLAWGGGTPSYSTMVNTMVHEFGHTIGFRHTNWDSRDEELISDHAYYGANHVSGTPTGDDDASVMTGGVIRGWSGFGFYDIRATRTIYPYSITLTATYQGDHPHLSWTSVKGASSYKLEYAENDCYEDQYGNTVCQWFSSVVTETTSLSYLDSNMLYTGDGESCGSHYSVRAVFPDGDTGRSDSAPVETC